MNSPFRRVPEALAIMLAFLSGLLAFGNYFFKLPFLTTSAQFLLKTVVLISAAALVLAAFNLLGRHLRRVQQKDVGSVLLIVGFIAALVAGLLPGGFQTGLGAWLYQWLLLPGMAALFALLPIFLAYALFRHLSVRDIGGFLLFLGMIIVLLGQIPSLASSFPVLAIFRRELLIAPTAAVFRGVILGLAVSVILAIFLKVFSRPRSSEGGREEEQA